MMTTVLDREAAQQESAQAHAEALFASDLSARREYTQVEIAAAIRQAIGAHNGIRGCVAEVAAAYGDHPETAARRMRWARAVVEGIGASAADRGEAAPGTAHRGAMPAAARPGASLTERGYVRGRFGGLPVLVGPDLAAQLKAIGQKQPRQ